MDRSSCWNVVRRAFGSSFPPDSLTLGTLYNRWPLALGRGWVDHDLVRSVIRYAANKQRVAPAN